MARKLEVEIVGDASSLHRALNQSQTGWRKWAKAGAIAGVAASVTTKAIDLLGEGLKNSVEAALDAQKVNARLGVAFKNVGLNVKSYQKQIDALDASSRRRGFTDEETKASLGSLLVSTKSYTASVKQLAVAQDLARFKSVSLEAATKALTMAHAGSLRPIKQLGIDIPKVTAAQDALKAATKDHTTEAYKNALATAKVEDKQATFQKVLATTTAAVHGQADAYASTAAGAMAQFHAQVQHIEVAVGEKLLPVMTNAIIWIRDHWPEISAAVKQSWETIKPTLTALIELVKSIVGAFRNNWSTIGPIVKSVARTIAAELKVVGDVIRVVAALLRGDWSGAWHSAQAAAKGVVAVFRGEIRTGLLVLKAALDAVLAGLNAVWGALRRKVIVPALRPVVALFNTLEGAIMAVVHAVESLIGALGRIHVPSIHIPGAGIIGHIPGLAAGGSVSRAGLAMVGERGPELLSLPAGASVSPLGSSGGGGPIYLITPDGKALAEFVFDGMRGQAQIFRQRTGRPAFG